MMLIKFAFVGGLGSVTNLAVFYVLSNFSIHYMLNSCICFLIAVSQNYFLNALFTFQSKELSLVQYISYVFANIFGLCINLCVLFIFRNFIFNELHFKDLLSQAFGVASAMIINFLLSKYFVFHRKNNE